MYRTTRESACSALVDETAHLLIEKPSLVQSLNKLCTALSISGVMYSLR